MKHILFLLVFLLSPLFISAQVNSGQSNGEVQNMKESLSSEDQQLVDSITNVLLEKALMNIVDSLRESGMYMKALSTVNQVMDYWQQERGNNPTISMYVSKVQILMHLEEWDSMIETCDECLRLYKDDTDVIVNLWLPLINKMRGDACRNSKAFKDAIISYENALFYYTRDNRLDNQGDIFCSMANCYEHLDKNSVASSFYDKGFEKYLEYFKVSRTGLLKSRIEETEDLRKSNLAVFSCHLYNMAVREQNLGNRQASKEYLLMSAHCGNEQAISEYNRIYGKY